jgi:transcriptional regulator with XRE-family HTH domain
MAVETNVDVAAKVRGVMAERGSNQARVADHLALSDMAVSRRMKGTTPFSPAELLKIARLFGVQVSVFFGESISDPAAHAPTAPDADPNNGSVGTAPTAADSLASGGGSSALSSTSAA